MTKVIGFDKIQHHPDKDEIITKLISGEPTRVIEAWLKAKYPNNRHNQVSYLSLQSFRKSHLKIDQAILKDLQKERKQQLIQRKYEQQQEMVQNTRAYQAGLANYVQDSLIDYNAEILQMMDHIREGIDNLRALNSSKSSHLNHQAISAYLEKYKSVIEMHHKMIEKQKKSEGDRLEENYEVLTKKMNILIEAVKETFNETNPEGLFVFISKIKDKMNEAGIHNDAI
jgi:hypothetical protein